MIQYVYKCDYPSKLMDVNITIKLKLFSCRHSYHYLLDIVSSALCWYIHTRRFDSW